MNKAQRSKLTNKREMLASSWMLAIEYQDHPKLGPRFIAQVETYEKQLANLERKYV